MTHDRIFNSAFLLPALQRMLLYFIVKGMKLSTDKILKISWNKVVQRKESLLMANYLAGGRGRKNTKAVLGLDCGSDYYLYLNSNIYLSSTDTKRNKKFLLGLLEKNNISIFNRWVKIWRGIGNKLISLSWKIKNTKVEKLSKAQLKKLFIDFSKLNFAFSTSLITPIDLEKIFEEKIANILNKKLKGRRERRYVEDYYRILTFPRRNNFPTLELLSFYRIISLLKQKLSNKSNSKRNIIDRICKSDLAIQKEIKRHLNEYSWIGTRWYLGKPWNFSDIVERIKHSIDENVHQKRKRLASLLSENNRKTKHIFRKLHFTKPEIALVNTAKDYVYVRTYRTDIFNKAGFLVRNLIKEIGNRFGYSFKEMIYLGVDEILGLFDERKVNKQIIQRRIKEFGTVHYKDKVYIFNQKQLDAIRSKIEKEIEIGDKDFIKGTIAHKGFAKGVVKIVISKTDLSKCGKGDILVAPMTTPEFVPAMEKAAAFITDEGGILCHAAIISREMQKPCIIGTKIATKVLKDGDVVEVNANHGIINVLKRK